MDNFEDFVQKGRVRIAPIVAGCNLVGDWGDGYFPGPIDFLVDGPPPGRCPNCNDPLSESESIDGGDCSIQLWLSCNPCGLVWDNGSAEIK